MTYRHKRYYTLTEKEHFELDNAEPYCLRCHQFLTADMIHCPKCGLHIHEDMPVDLTITLKPTAADKKTTMPVIDPTTQEHAIKHFCTNCGTEIGDKKFCPECGTKSEVK